MAAGSGKITDLNDFVTPAQDCVVPLIAQEKPDLIKPRRKKRSDPAESTVAQVSLYDCLACSGCVTTAETILVQEQSIEIFLAGCQEKPFTVISFSPSSVRQIAKHFRLPTSVCLQKLSALFRFYYRVTAVLSTLPADAFVLVEQTREFVQRKRHLPLPVVSSHCPAWVCTLEKTLPKFVASMSSELKSSQQITGLLSKTLLLESVGLRQRFFAVARPMCLYASQVRKHCLQAKHWELAPQGIFHCCVMSCYDKKLESVRDEGKVDSAKEVDCVLTTREVFELLERAGICDFAQYPFSAPLDSLALGTETWPIWKQKLEKNLPPDILFVLEGKEPIAEEFGDARFSYENYYSNSSLEFTFRRAAFLLCNVEIPWDEPLKFVTIGNSDLKETRLERGGKILLRFMFAYGARNMKNLGRILSNDMTGGAIDFVEVMACPRGCISGGGQVCLSRQPHHLPCGCTESSEQEFPRMLAAHKLPSVKFFYKYFLQRAQGLNAIKTVIGQREAEVPEGYVALSALKW